MVTVRWWGVALAVGIAACTGASDTTSDATSDLGTSSLCASDTRALHYAVGVQATSADKSVAVRFLDSNPAPPALYNNEFTVMVVDGAGAAIPGATIALPKPVMPDHGHPTQIQPVIAGGTAPNTFVVSKVYLFMGGLWKLTFDVTLPSGAKSSPTIMFCIDG